MISSVAHEENVLEVEFKNGRRYQYPGISKKMFRALIDSGSPGKFFNENIKGKFGS